MAFKDRLKEARNMKGLTQEQLGQQLNIAKSTVAGYERGSSEPDMAKLQKMMSILGVDANFLLQDEMAAAGAISEDREVQVENGDERQLLIFYRQLSDEGKESIQKQMILHMNTYKKSVPDTDMEASEELA